MCFMIGRFFFLMITLLLSQNHRYSQAELGVFSNGCKSSATRVIKDADINILVCKLIPSASCEAEAL